MSKLKNILIESVYDDVLKAVPDNYSYKDLADVVANIIKNEYGSHNIKPFLKQLSKVLKEGINEGTRCWKGYEKKGMKTMFGKRVPNCVKKENAVPDHDGKAAPFGSGYDELEEDLRKWVKQKWVDISRKKKGGGHPACGASAGSKSRKGGKRAYPKCVPASKAARMSKKDKASATRRKRAVYKNKAKGGKPPKKAKNVSTKAESILREKLIAYLEQMNEKAKRDKCYYKVKARYDVWPSAYGSLSLSKCRKVGAANWGNKSKKK